ncbi:MAG TPA: cysteine-rich CWC family protein [Rhodoferax sp.]|nr:cysteine-rich CWC family protein [Rhodoferax sp.]HNV58201.1 cysteine-rich CWC family protein [Rhodoferax sp.]
MPAPAPDRTAVDPRLCPLCGQSNQCANEVERETGVLQGPCWCTTATFDASLLARIPPAAQRLACVCERCASAASPN